MAVFEIERERKHGTGTRTFSLGEFVLRVGPGQRTFLNKWVLFQEQSNLHCSTSLLLNSNLERLQMLRIKVTQS